MEKVIGKLRQWIAVADQGLPTTEDDVQVAAAALLIHAMRVDDESHPVEAGRVREVLQSHFEIGDGELDELMEQGAVADDTAVDLYRFTRVLTANLDQDGRKRIVRMLWEVVMADGAIHEFEANLVWRVSELIGVSREDRIRLRQEVVGAGSI